MIDAIDCIRDVEQRMKGLGIFGATNREKVVTVYSEDDLLSKMKFAVYPACGVMYEGTVRQPSDKSSSGAACILTVALVLMIDGNSVGSTNDKGNVAAEYLGLMRQSFKKNCGDALTGHKWVFISEMPVGTSGNVTMYLQRWSTSIII